STRLGQGQIAVDGAVGGGQLAHRAGVHARPVRTWIWVCAFSCRSPGQSPTRKVDSSCIAGTQTRRHAPLSVNETGLLLARTPEVQISGPHRKLTPTNDSSWPAARIPPLRPYGRIPARRQPRATPWTSHQFPVEAEFFVDGAQFDR